MAVNEVQILIVVDVRPGVSEDLLRELMERTPYERISLPLTKFGAPSLPEPEEPHDVDWPALGQAIEEVAREVHRLQEQYKPRPVSVYIGGKAPLSAFIHLGYKFSGSVSQVFVLNQSEKNGPWERFCVGAPPSGLDTPPMFEPARGIPETPSVAEGRLGIYIDTMKRKENLEPMKALLREWKEPIADIARLTAGESLRVHELNIDAVVRDIKNFLATVGSHWPECRGTAIFAAVPTQVAVAIGRSMSANVNGRDVWLTDYSKARSHYDLAYSLPFEPVQAPALPMTDAAKLARLHVFEQVSNALEYLQKYLRLPHMPEGLLDEEQRNDFVNKVHHIRLRRDHIEQQPFEVLVGQDEMSLGAHVLEAIVKWEAPDQRDFAKLVMLHEIVHDWQDLTYATHPWIGRAGYVLEGIDFVADAFAVETLLNMELAMNEQARDEVAKRLQRYTWMVLRGIEAFDRMEQGPRIKHLTERRLRRYLLWHVQHARAALVKTADDARKLLQSTLTVELAPLPGYIDSARGEKVVRGKIADVELCIAVNGRLVRVQKQPGESLDGLVELIRDYKHAEVQKVMHKVVYGKREVLAGWGKR